MMLALTNGVTHFRCQPSVTASLLEENQLRGTSIEDGAQDHDPAFLGDAAFVGWRQCAENELGESRKREDLQASETLQAWVAEQIGLHLECRLPGSDEKQGGTFRVVLEFTSDGLQATVCFSTSSWAKQESDAGL